MRCMFVVTTSLERRAHARVLQVLDNQKIDVHSFVASTDLDCRAIHALLEIDSATAVRVHNLLLRVESVLTVGYLQPSQRGCRTMALSEIRCDHNSQLKAVENTAALEFEVVEAGPRSMVVEIAGSFTGTEQYEKILSRFGEVILLAKATFGVVRPA